MVSLCLICLILYVPGPKGGEIIGPLDSYSSEIHHCFANRVLAHLALNNEEDQRYEGQHPDDVTCKARCPVSVDAGYEDVSNDDGWKPPHLSNALFAATPDS